VITAADEVAEPERIRCVVDEKTAKAYDAKTRCALGLLHDRGPIRPLSPESW
jgi:hypothetical protein